tara:strand:+ start:1 stop:846 length:846 start_codon:yes stop_codon:yes gene_type:complete
MYANFTEETCTGTGDILTLSGLTTGNLTFSTSFADGDLVSYVVEDSGGSIKVAGVGTYNTANTITRNDSWNYNGTVVDKNPSTNIVLSAGTHTVRCDAVAANLRNMSVIKSAIGNYIPSAHHVASADATGFSLLPNILYCSPFLLRDATEVSALGTYIAGVAGANVIFGIASADNNGQPDLLIAETATIPITTGNTFTGSITPIILNAGWHYLLAVVDLGVNCAGVTGSTLATITPLGMGNNRPKIYASGAYTFGALPTDVGAAITSYVDNSALLSLRIFP